MKKRLFHESDESCNFGRMLISDFLAASFTWPSCVKITYYDIINDVINCNVKHTISCFRHSQRGERWLTSLCCFCLFVSIGRRLKQWIVKSAYSYRLLQKLSMNTTQGLLVREPLMSDMFPGRFSWEFMLKWQHIKYKTYYTFNTDSSIA